MKFNFILTVVIPVIIGACGAPKPEQPDLASEAMVNIDSASGLVIDENFELVRAQCTPCHSAKLVTQNSASREGWEQMIRWMQKDQGLWDLGENESLILDYLAQHYGVKRKGRRAPLTNIEWYPLEKSGE